MPRFYFDTHNGETLNKDEVGLELAGIVAARVEAQRALSEVVCDARPNTKQRTICLRVRMENGRTVVKAAVPVMVEVEP